MAKNNKVPAIRFSGYTDTWEQCKLGEFVNIVSGDAPSTFISGNCIYVKVDDLNYSDRIQLSSSNLVNANPKAHLVNTGATIFPKRGAAIMTNKVRIMGQDGYLDTNMMALIPKEIDKDFLFTFIQKTGLYKISDTSTIPQINNKHIEPYMIQVPTNKEQECIGVFFEKIDKIITLHQRKLEKLKLTKKALLRKLFPQNGSKFPELRFKEFTDAWEKRKLGDLAEIVRGASPRPISDPKWFDNDSDVGWLRIADVTAQDGRIRYLEQKISELGQEKTRVIKTPHLLLSIAATVGKPVINYVSTGVHDGFLIFLNPKFNILYTFWWLEMFREKWNKYGQPGSQVNLNSDLVKNQDINIPNEKEQEKISLFLESLDKIITLHQCKLEMLKNVKKGLLQKMFV